MGIKLGIFNVIIIFAVISLFTLLKSSNKKFIQILFWTYIGNIVFNVLGTVNVVFFENVYKLNFKKNEVLEEFLLLQLVELVLLFIPIYLYSTIKRKETKDFTYRKDDKIILTITYLLMMVISISYFVEIGRLPIIDFFNNQIPLNASYQYRARYVYGLKNWPIFNLGVNILTIINFCFGYFIIKCERKNIIGYILMITSVAIVISMGSKAGALSFILIIIVSELYFTIKNGKIFWSLIKNKFLISFSMITMIYAIFGYMRVTAESEWAHLIKRIWYRMFVTYSETIVGTISYEKNVGMLFESALPNLRGLFPHEYAVTPLLMHKYMSGNDGGMNVPFIGEGFLMGGWLGAISVLFIMIVSLIIVQELFNQVEMGLSKNVLEVFYCLMGISLSINGMTSTFLTIMYPALFVSIFIIFIIFKKIERVYENVKI